MSLTDPRILGLVLLALGAGLILLTLIAVRLIQQHRRKMIVDSGTSIDLDLPPHSEAILLVRPGGEVAFINQTARDWFGIPEGNPNLELLSRHIRPSENFISICAAEGKLSFSLDGRPIDGISYHIPYGAGYALLVALHKPKLSLLDEEAQAGEEIAFEARRALETYVELGQKISASLDLNATLLTLLENIERLVPADELVVSLCGLENENPVSYHLRRAPGKADRLERSSEPRPRMDGFTTWLISKRQPLFLPDTTNAGDGLQPAENESFPYRSYLGVPLIASQELVGTLELGSLIQDAFTKNDLEVLELMSDQAAVALHNALQYEEEGRRVQELAGLAQLAQVVSSLREPSELYARLVESISPLLDVKIIGFLIYDEIRRTLEGQLPFAGLPPDVIEWTRAPVPSESEAEKLWQSQEMIHASEAKNDPRLKALGLDNLAVAVGIRHTVLMPLATGGRMLGYLLVADKQDGTGFEQSDLRLLSIIAAQAAPIIENSALVQLSSHRAQRAETLRRIASLTGSAATLDEILKFSLQDLARLLQADKAAIFLLDESRGELRLHKDSLFGISSELATRLGRLPTDDPQYRHTITNRQQPFTSDDASQEANILPVYRQLVKTMDVRSVIIVPLIVREQSIGELILGSNKPHFFNIGDLQSVVTASGQLAGATEQAKLYSQTDESLRRRVEQLTSITRISHELNSTLDLSRLLQRVYEEVLRTTQADCGTILLFELNDSHAEAEPEEPLKVMHYLGDPPGVELHPLERMVLERKEAVIIKDFEQTIDIRRSSSGYIPPSRPTHQGVRSAMIVPIAYQDQVAGLIHLHARAPYQFDETSKAITETLAIQAAIALGNALRYQEQVRKGEQLNRRVETLAKVLEISQAMQQEDTHDQALAKIASAIQEITPFDIVLISVYDEASSSLRRRVGTGIPAVDMEELKAHQQSWSSLQKILLPEFSIGHSYLIPYERMPIVPENIHTVTILPAKSMQDEGGNNNLTWHPEDMFLVPLEDAGGRPLGLISLDAPRNNLRPDRTTIEAVEIFGSQAAYLIENQQHVASLNARLNETQRALNQTQKAAARVDDHISSLSQKDLEQTIAIQDLSRRARRIQAGMDIAEIINRQNSRAEVLLALGREILVRMDMGCALVAENGPHGPRLIHALGNIQEGVNIEALLGQRNPLHHTLMSGGSLLIADTKENPDWSGSPLLQALDTGSFICLAIQTAGGTNAAILATSPEALPSFTQDDEQLFLLLTRMAGVILGNLSLLGETSRRLEEVNLLLDFNRQLGSLEPGRILQTLVESARHVLPQAQTSLVVLWDLKRGLLVPQAASGYSNPERLLEITFEPGETLPGQVLRSGEPLWLEEVDFAGHYRLTSEDLPRYRDATNGKLPVSCMLVPIKRAPSATPLGVLLLENFATASAFTAEHLAMVSSLTQQTALTLENTQLYRASERRASQLQALTSVAASITSSLQLDDLVSTLLDQLYEILPYDTGTLWMREGEQAIVRAARGFKDSEERLGLSVTVEDSLLLNEMIQTSQPISVGDIRKDPRFSALREHEHLSWLGMPLIASRKVIGVIALEKTEAEYYTPEDVQIAATFAGQAAVALENARLFQESLTRAFELDQRSQRLEMLNRLSANLSETLDAARILAAASQELYDSLSCTGVSAILLDAPHQIDLVAEHPQTSPALPLTLPEISLFEHLGQTLGIYYTEDIAGEEGLSPLKDYLASRGAQSLLVLPLVTGNDLHGAFLVQSDQPHRFSAEEVGLGRTISNQTAIAVQNARLYAETRRFSEDLEERVQKRTAELAREHQRAETLLRIITELSASLDLEQVLNRTLKVLNEIVDAEQITLLVQREGEKRLHHLASVGYIPVPVVEKRETAFASDQGLAGWVISHCEAALIPNVLEDHRWVQLPGTPSAHRSAIGVPLMIGAEALGALLFFHRQLNHFSADQLDLVQAAANQVAVAVNNAELYRLIRDQAEDLGKMLREQQIEASRSRAILEAVADGVLVTDARRYITLFNASAERVLGLERTQVIGKSLEHFSGLFGRAANDWMETVRLWSQDPSTHQRGEVYEQQITLEDERVISVHLAPVSLREQFLGTVSIFRDITHQVEVDRLKSEFVATVSHELRTPMTSIKGYVDVLLMGAAGELSEQQNHFLEIVKNNTERLTVLVNDLLDISRIETGRIILSMQPVDMRGVADKARERFVAKARDDKKAMKFRVKGEPDLPLVLGDVERIAQILDNLLENAYNYTAEGGKITLSIHRAGEELQVDVIDTGIGIPVEAQPRVFERFYRGDHPYVLATSGTGLGLAIVQHLVEMHSGRIWLESKGIAGEGSTFSFTLPVYIPEKQENVVLGMK